jgi:hypothetical protein
MKYLSCNELQKGHVFFSAPRDPDAKEGRDVVFVLFSSAPFTPLNLHNGASALRATSIIEIFIKSDRWGESQC